MAIVVSGLALALPSPAQGAAERAPARIELSDQFERAHRVVFPAPKVTVLAIADRRGSEQIDSWIEAVHARYGERIDFRGIADCGGAPRLLHGRIRAGFRDERKQPVMLDWSGEVSAALGYEAGVANLLIVARDGRILHRFAGPADAGRVAAFRRALDAVLDS